MDVIRNLLFTYDGRINRGQFWFALLIWVIAGFGATAVLSVMTWLPAFLFTGLLILFLIFLLISQVFVGIKRLHDHGKSGWWLLLYYLTPAVLQQIGLHVGQVGTVFLIAAFPIGMWMLVELFFLPGTVGPNRYGPDPTLRRDPREASQLSKS